MSNINVYKDTNITLDMLEDRGIMKKNNFVATAKPADSAATADLGYSVGSLWVNTASTTTVHRAYICTYAKVTGGTVNIRWSRLSNATTSSVPAA